MNWGLIIQRKFLYEGTMIWNRTVHIVTRLEAGWSAVWLVTGARNIFSPKFQDQLCCPSNLLFSGDKAVGAWSWLLLRLRMRGAIPWFPVCALLACIRTNLALYFHKRVCPGGKYCFDLWSLQIWCISADTLLSEIYSSLRVEYINVAVSWNRIVFCLDIGCGTVSEIRG